jgi:hypothetical protein
MINERILRTAKAFDELHALVMSEPALADFLPATAELCAIAARARAGQPLELSVAKEATARIPTRELAERILDVVHRAPGALGTEDAETIRTLAVMHANLVRGVIHALFVDFDDLMK